ncbi:hypothetical protein O9H85_32690 [Paenibacillus filicis]|uniref:Uncharacterized protein n=1 Tax=Paenibacillus gyeongsangnamensis TaxID=3388067 RepID=A0ABT4QJH7_9BACL|nr:hypothetical protein [Paenibacillus filicis]MCZ8517032.1 hypothetical protein [Paenibacillus filicis]
MINKISEWTIKHQIEKRTIEGFWLNFYGYMEEYRFNQPHEVAVGTIGDLFTLFGN